MKLKKLSIADLESARLQLLREINDAQPTHQAAIAQSVRVQNYLKERLKKVDDELQSRVDNLFDNKPQEIDKQPVLKVFVVSRPYCNPSTFALWAENEQQAVEVSNNMFGFCSDTTAKESKPRTGQLILQG